MLAGVAACSCLEIPVQEGGDIRIRIQCDDVGNQEGSGKEEDLMVRPSRNKSRRAGLWEALSGACLCRRGSICVCLAGWDVV